MLQLRQLVVSPGQRVQLRETNWQEFEAILDELGDKRASRIAYTIVLCGGKRQWVQNQCLVNSN